MAAFSPQAGNCTQAQTRLADAGRASRYRHHALSWTRWSYRARRWANLRGYSGTTTWHRQRAYSHHRTGRNAVIQVWSAGYRIAQPGTGCCRCRADQHSTGTHSYTPILSAETPRTWIEAMETVIGERLHSLPADDLCRPGLLAFL